MVRTLKIKGPLWELSEVKLPYLASGHVVSSRQSRKLLLHALQHQSETAERAADVPRQKRVQQDKTTASVKMLNVTTTPACIACVATVTDIGLWRRQTRWRSGWPAKTAVAPMESNSPGSPPGGDRSKARHKASTKSQTLCGACCQVSAAHLLPFISPQVAEPIGPPLSTALRVPLSLREQRWRRLEATANSEVARQ
jgi:hypothetical protein